VIQENKHVPKLLLLVLTEQFYWIVSLKKILCFGSYHQITNYFLAFLTIFVVNHFLLHYKQNIRKYIVLVHIIKKQILNPGGLSFRILNITITKFLHHKFNIALDTIIVNMTTEHNINNNDFIVRFETKGFHLERITYSNVKCTV